MSKPLTPATLPEGWSLEPLPHGRDVAVLYSPSRLMATIDFDARGYRSGYTTTGRFVSVGAYTGRGWREHLVADAVTWLQAVEAQP